MKKYINRELSWLDFNYRVLREATDKELKLIDKFKFLSIFSSNLDEFFMVRLGSLKDQMNAGYDREDFAGYTPEEQFIKSNEKIKDLVKHQEELASELIKESKKNGLEFIKYKDLSKNEKKEVENYFKSDIFPVLTPLAIDPSRPFHLLANKTIYLAIKILRDNKIKTVVLGVPSIIPRVYEINRTSKKVKIILLEEIIKNNLNILFEDAKIESISQFRITRNGDLSINEDDAEDLLMVIENSLRQRKWGEVIRLEVLKGYDEKVIENLIYRLKVRDECIYSIDEYMDMTFMMKLKGPQSSSEFLRVDHKPKKLKSLNRKDIFGVIRERDLLFHFPYDSFDYVTDFVKKASEDEKVLAIKQTLYRVNGDSEIIKALIKAAENGKQVTVLVELKARFDEENNIHWAKVLEKTGANVIYGVPGLKTHSKLLLVVRKEEDGIKRYVNIATGNYNAITAKLYTDFSMFTSREDIASDASHIFNLISGFASSRNMNRLIYAPDNLRSRIKLLIDNEINASKNGKKAVIKIVVNSLLDKEIIDKLYEASKHDVQIYIVVRGICSIIPGVKGLSENIHVKSIIGEFLEHSRIYYFKNGNPDDLYIGSADVMSRNLDRRIELLTPVVDEMIRERIKLILKLMWLDNQKSWTMDSKGEFTKLKADKDKIHLHEILKSLEYSNDKEFINKLKNLL